MQTAAVFVWNAGIGMAIMGVLAVLLAVATQRPFLTQLALMFLALVFACTGGWLALNACTLRSQGLGQTLGKTSRVVPIATHSVETLISFGFSVLLGSALCLCGLFAAVIVLLPDKNKPSESQEDNAVP